MWYSISSLIFVVSLVVLTGLLGQSLLLLLGLRDSPGNAQVTSFLALPLGLGVVITLLFVLALLFFTDGSERRHCGRPRCAN